MQILIVEDDLILIDLLTEALAKDFKIDLASNWQRAKTLLANHHYQLIILNHSLLDSFTLKKFYLSIQPAVLLIVSGLSCLRHNLFEPGPSDFLIAPFTLDELKQKIEILLSWQQLPNNRNLRSVENKLFLNSNQRTVNYLNKTIILNKKEFALLSLLIHRQEQVLSRQLLANLVWENDLVVFGNTIATHVNRLRQKLKTLNCPYQIKTYRGVGYLWTLK